MGFNTKNYCITYESENYAFVLMLRSMNVNWKQPIAYFFSV